MPETPNHKIYFPSLTDLPDIPADAQRTALSVDTALTATSSVKQDAPTNNTTMLTWALGQTNNPVTVWATSQNTTNNPSNGQNVQLQWCDTRPFGWTGSYPEGRRLRLHIDAKHYQAGRIFEDIPWAFGERRTGYGPYGYGQSTNRAVLIGGINGTAGNDTYLTWVAPYIRAQVDTTWVGDFAYKDGSSIRIKDIIENNLDVAVIGGFVDTIKPKLFRYKDQVGVVAEGQRGKTHIGFIAEEVRDAAKAYGLPSDTVQYDTDGLPNALNDTDLIAALWTTVQDLRKRVSDLESQLIGE